MTKYYKNKKNKNKTKKLKYIKGFKGGNNVRELREVVISILHFFYLLSAKKHRTFFLLKDIFYNLIPAHLAILSIHLLSADFILVNWIPNAR
jgi:hypothetical protein